MCIPTTKQCIFTHFEKIKMAWSKKSFAEVIKERTASDEANRIGKLQDAERARIAKDQSRILESTRKFGEFERMRKRQCQTIDEENECLVNIFIEMWNAHDILSRLIEQKGGKDMKEVIPCTFRFSTSAWKYVLQPKSIGAASGAASGAAELDTSTPIQNSDTLDKCIDTIIEIAECEKISVFMRGRLWHDRGVSRVELHKKFAAFKTECQRIRRDQCDTELADLRDIKSIYDHLESYFDELRDVRIKSIEKSREDFMSGLPERLQKRKTENVLTFQDFFKIY